MACFSPPDVELTGLRVLRVGGTVLVLCTELGWCMTDCIESGDREQREGERERVERERERDSIGKECIPVVEPSDQVDEGDVDGDLPARIARFEPWEPVVFIIGQQDRAGPGPVDVQLGAQSVVVPREEVVERIVSAAIAGGGDFGAQQSVIQNQAEAVGHAGQQCLDGRAAGDVLGQQQG